MKPRIRVMHHADGTIYSVPGIGSLVLKPAPGEALVVDATRGIWDVKLCPYMLPHLAWAHFARLIGMYYTKPGRCFEVPLTPGW